MDSSSTRIPPRCDSWARDRWATCWAKSPADLLHPDSRPSVARRIAELSAGQTLSMTEERIVRLDGTVLDVEITGNLFEDHLGSGLQVIVRDITARKRTEAALRESEERLRLAFAGAQEGVWDWNLETGAVVYSVAMDADARIRDA